MYLYQELKTEKIKDRKKQATQNHINGSHKKEVDKANMEYTYLGKTPDLDCTQGTGSHLKYELKSVFNVTSLNITAQVAGNTNFAVGNWKSA